MDIRAELESLDRLVDRLRVYVMIDAEEWKTAQKTLAALVAEAERLGQRGRISQYVTRLRHHLGVLIGVVASDGHSHDQHVIWAIGDMQALRSFAAFGPALDRLDESPSGAVH
jgi:hypothetical protein